MLRHIVFTNFNYMIRYFLIFFTILCSYYSDAQNKIEIKGVIKNAVDSSNLGKVNIHIANTNIGSISNQNGNFKIIASSNSIVQFSHIGFHTTKAPLNKLKTDETIYLHPNIIEIKEFHIESEKINLEKNLKESIKKNNENFIHDTHLYKSYYSERILKDNQEIRFLEAALSIYDKHPIQKKISKNTGTKTVLNGLRKNEISKYETDLINGNNLELLLSFSKIHPLVNRHKKETLKLDSVKTYNGREVYIITGYFKKSLRSKYFIFKDDSSFFKVQNIRNFPLKIVSLPNRPFELMSLKRIYTEVILEKNGVQVHPKFIDYQLTTIHWNKENILNEITRNCQLLINDIIPTKIPSNQFIDTKTDLWLQKPLQKDFDWKSYNKIMK